MNSKETQINYEQFEEEYRQWEEEFHINDIDLDQMYEDMVLNKKTGDKDVAEIK